MKFVNVMLALCASLSVKNFEWYLLRTEYSVLQVSRYLEQGPIGQTKGPVG